MIWTWSTTNPWIATATPIIWIIILIIIITTVGLIIGQRFVKIIVVVAETVLRRKDVLPKRW